VAEAGRRPGYRNMLIGKVERVHGFPFSENDVGDLAQSGVTTSDSIGTSAFINVPKSEQSLLALLPRSSSRHRGGLDLIAGYRNNRPPARFRRACFR
jgi:hypothetical protein